jgi:hypothetical protein
MQRKLEFYETEARQVKRVVCVQGYDTESHGSSLFPVQDAEEELEMNCTERLKLTEKVGKPSGK